MTNLKNKFVRVSLIVFACILSAMLLFMPFLLKDKRSVFADATDVQSYTFSGSQIVFGITARDIRNPSDDTYHSTNDAILNFKVSNLKIDVNDSSKFYFDFDSWLFYKNDYNDSLGRPTVFHYLKSFSFPIGTSTNFYSALKSSYGSNAMYYPFFYCWINCPSTFNFNVQFVTLESIWHDSNHNRYIYYIKYYDSNGSALVFSFDNIYMDSDVFGITNSLSTSTSPDYYSSRSYYFSNNVSLSDNAFYQQGVSDGYNDGLSVGDSQGYERGYNNGYSVGERTGFNDGVASANDYSFLGLFGAIVDAPLSAFSGLFDFNLSFDGVHNFNLKGFFLAMLSIAIVIAIIRLALRK